LDCDSKFYGEDLYNYWDYLSFKRVIENGYVQRMDDLEFLLNKIYSEVFYIEPDEYSAAVTMKYMNRKKDLEKIVEIMFENFNVP
jgi:actin-related protein